MMVNKARLSDRLSRIKPSPSLAANDLVARLRSEGRDIINFTVGEPDFDTPEHIITAAISAMRNGETHYTPASGTLALRTAVSEKLSRDNRLNYAPAEIVCGCGGKHIISHAFSSTLMERDEVIIHAPYWVSYPDLALLNDARPVIIEGREETDFKLMPHELENAITPNTKWVIINSPNNPSGAVYTAEELSALAAVLRKYPHVLIMLDEIYEYFVYAGNRHLSMAEVAPDLKARMLIINGASKGYAMTGWRIGYGAGPTWLISAIAKLISQTTTCPSSVSQAAAIAAFSGDQAPVQHMLTIYQQRRDRISDLLGAVPGLRFTPPSGAFYLFLNVAGVLGKTTPGAQRICSDDDLVAYLLQEGGVATVGGRAYGLSPYIRISFASSMETIEEGCRRIKKALSLLA